MFFNSHSKVEGCEKSENVSLDECHQQFQETHKYSECNGNRCHRHPQHDLHLTENKDQAHKAQDNDMPCTHVCKKTNHEYERLGEHPH